MLKIDNSLVSEEIITKDFVCNLSACKGACCVEGEAGAPIDKEETKLLEKHYDAIAPFMNKKGRAAISNSEYHLFPNFLINASFTNWYMGIFKLSPN